MAMPTKRLCDAPWFRSLGIRGGGKLAFFVKDVAPLYNGAPRRIRGLCVTEPVSKGETLAVVPREAIPTGQSALRYVAGALGGDTSAADRLLSAVLRPRPEVFTNLVVKPPLLSSRETAPVLVALAVAKLSSEPCGFATWVADMPRQAPPLAPLIDFVLTHTLQRKKIVPGDGCIGNDEPQRPLVERFPVPFLDARCAVPSNALLKPLTGSKARSMLDRPWPEHHVTLSDVEAAEAALREWLHPVAAALSDAMGVDHEACAASLAWAHFTMRSRVVVVGQGADPRLVPVADMINHGRGATAIVREIDQGVASGLCPRAEPQSVLIAAARRLNPGEEITLNYGERMRVRHALGAERRIPRVGAQSRCASDSSLTLTDEQRVQQRYAAVLANEELQVALEDRDILDDELAWAWTYGFPKSEADRLQERQVLWEDRLSDRVGRMLDRSRRGSRGDFCVGVPPGVSHMRDARQRVETRLYQGQRVFPQQAH